MRADRGVPIQHRQSQRAQTRARPRAAFSLSQLVGETTATSEESHVRLFDDEVPI